ncbi:MAG: hypothetical protein L6R41_001776 [Letrouitia leprolyta]|nr:MAG: hypothetical protein L6R41_001776 [Letrouitia leprolyta]
MSEKPHSPSTNHYRSQPNLNNLHIPAAFKVDLEPEPNIPIDGDDINRVAFEMMFTVSGQPITHVWLDQDWYYPYRSSGISIRHVGYGKDPSRLSTQYIIWGLNHVLLSMKLLNRYCQTTAILKWNGDVVGSILLLKATPVDGSNRRLQNQSILIPPSQDSSSLSLEFQSLNIVLKYGAKQIEKKLLYLTAIKAMGEACERGLESHVPGMMTTGLQKVQWKLLNPSREVRTIEVGYSRLAAAKSLARMSLDDTFSEVLVLVNVDGARAAVGGFTQAS